MASASFQIDPGTTVYGAAGIAQNATAAATVNCRLVSTAGVNPGLITWTIFGTHDSAQVAPTIAESGIPTGQIATFTLPSGTGQAYGIQCDVNGGVEITGESGTTSKSAVFVLNDAGERPFFVGETFEEDATHGYVERLNAMSGRQHNIYKTADEAITTDNMFNVDADLVMTLAAGVYLVEGFIHFTSDTGPDFKFRLGGDGTFAINDILVSSLTAHGTGTTMACANSVSLNQSIAVTIADTQRRSMRLTGYVDVSTAGEFRFEWAQDTSDAAATTVYKGSWLKFTNRAT